jgi:hypothetical protein
MKMHMMKILYMASIYGLVREKKNYSGLYEKTAAKQLKKIYSGFYEKTIAKTILQSHK